LQDLDQALERFQLCGLEYGSGLPDRGLPNYGPMAAEALIELGHAALVTGLIDVYVPRLPPRPGGRVLSDTERSSALGSPGRFGDWIVTLEARLQAEPWREVLADEVAGLVGGLNRDSAHGLVRVAHAVLAIERAETPIRVKELAFGLAHWAGRYAEAADAVSSFQSRGPRGGDGADLPLSQDLARACVEGARRYLANPEARAEHTLGVMAPAALRVLLPYVEPSCIEQALSILRAIQGPAPMVAAQARKIETVDDVEVERCAGSVEEIRYRAACSLQEHAIPFAEACLREEALAPASELRLAAADAALRLSPVGYQEWR